VFCSATFGAGGVDFEKDLQKIYKDFNANFENVLKALGRKE
jgi:hypothetical protein